MEYIYQVLIHFKPKDQTDFLGPSGMEITPTTLEGAIEVIKGIIVSEEDIDMWSIRDLKTGETVMVK